MMSEKAKKELSDYQKALNRKDKHKSVPKKKSQRKGQGKITTLKCGTC